MICIYIYIKYIIYIYIYIYLWDSLGRYSICKNRANGLTAHAKKTCDCHGVKDLPNDKRWAWSTVGRRHHQPRCGAEHRHGALAAPGQSKLQHPMQDLQDLSYLNLMDLHRISYPGHKVIHQSSDRPSDS